MVVGRTWYIFPFLFLSLNFTDIILGASALNFIYKYNEKEKLKYQSKRLLIGSSSDRDI